MTDPDSLSFGIILRELAIRVAQLEQPHEAFADLTEIREKCLKTALTITVSDADGANSIMLRAQAQAIIEHLLDD